ncbi:MAG: hypothetical protein KKD44_15080 [Proteobacteria bacterium]|nr:hypothetical protein [Pseudomonadota bacterium]
MDKDNYLKLRNKYLPEALKLIFILESPPASGKYFYNETGKTTEPLFNEMMKTFHYKPADKKDGLEFFKSQGFFLVDSTYKPVNKMKGKEREATILSDFGNLVADLEAINGKQSPLVLVKANICRFLENQTNIIIRVWGLTSLKVRPPIGMAGAWERGGKDAPRNISLT